MRFVLGPPWLRLAAEVADEELGERMTELLLALGAGRGREAADLTLSVVYAAAGETWENGFTFRDGAYGGGGELGRGSYDVEGRRGAVEIRPAGITFFETFLRQVFLWEGLGRGATAFHGVALARGGDALISCGPSGSGKSTLAGLLAPTFAVYSDEMNYITARGDVWPFPVRGTGVEEVRGGGGTLKALAVHRPGKVFVAMPLGPAAAFRALRENVVLPLGAADRFSKGAFDSLAALVENYPVYDVRVPLDAAETAAGFGELIDAPGVA